MPGLPNELTDQIIQELHSEHKSLKNCALVCQSWVVAAQRNLFTKLNVHERNVTEIVDHLSSGSPRIADYVQHLYIFLWGNLRVRANRMAVSEARPLLPHLLSQLSHFTNLKQLELDGCRVFHDKQWDVSWTDPLVAACPSLSHLNIQHITFQDIPDLVDLVSSFQTLKQLTAGELDVASASHEYSNEPQEPYEGSKVPPPLISKIQYASGHHFSSGTGPFLRWLAGGTLPLRTLDLCLDAEVGDVNAGVELIQSAGRNLEHLSLEFSDQWHLWEGFDLAANTSLRSLVLKSVDDFDSEIVEFLQSLTGPLEYLTLGRMDQIESDERRSLIEVLMSPAFASLTRVNLYTLFVGSEGLADEIANEHPEFLKRGIAFIESTP
ncbi:hypothetical protein FB45DRAFT_516685 [Roridomyces roridus]|uniref:F-box domain-containing protein n=1 Tax=Roridomyces roridus TaxID=1738132 RepID=A0AAD7BX59_9AGAR|nr:hypothetical protein FB45DRAFT_516685 [Roridomyces roridus]